jgi:basic amino acid/polyamine antiporter, APA family
MAHNGAFFSAAGKLHPTWRSPYVAVIAQGICCCVLILTGTFESLAYYIGFTLFLFSALSVLAIFRFRQRPGWKRSRWVNIAYPLLPLIYVATNVWVFVYFAQLRRLEAIWTVVTILVGALVYRFYIRARTTDGRL